MAPPRTQLMGSPAVHLSDSQENSDSNSKDIEAQDIASDHMENPPEAVMKPFPESVPSSGIASANDHQHRPKRCRRGLHCRLLHKSDTSCHFYHPPDEIAAYHRLVSDTNPLTYASSTSVPVSNSTSGGGMKAKGNCSKTAPPANNATAAIENREDAYEEILIDRRCAPIIIGKNFKKIRGLMKTSGAKIKIDRKSDVNGMNIARITGSPSSVKVACQLVVEAAARASETVSPSGSALLHTKQEEISVLSEASLTEEVSSSTDTHTATDEKVIEGVENELMMFLDKHSDCLKCSPSAFYEWLISLDVLSIRDLMEACADIDFVKTEMQANGLKGFKRGPFTKAAQKLLA